MRTRSFLFTVSSVGIIFSLFCISICLAGQPDADNTRFRLLPRSTNDLALLDFSKPDIQKQFFLSKGTKVTNKSGALVITGSSGNFGCAFSAGEQLWNLSNHLYVATDVHNLSHRDLVIRINVESAENSREKSEETVTRLPAGKSTTVLVYLKRKADAQEQFLARFPRMNALPNGYMPLWGGLSPECISKLTIVIESPTPATAIEISNLRATGLCDWSKLQQPDFFPFIDRYGQYIHADWSGKIHTPEDFTSHHANEAANLKSQPRLDTWNQYGGFKNGPRLKAAGHFRVEKYQNKWWLVDPTGCLFWSHGITGVGANATTSVNGRKNFFAEIPPDGSKTISFYEENLNRKYGPDFEKITTALAHQRLQAWGLNTMANWSNPEVTNLRQTPYTKSIHIPGPILSHQQNHQLYDPFDAAFTTNLRAVLTAEKDKTADDPWCIGYFINNELYWSGGPAIANDVLAAPKTATAKQTLLRHLRERHLTIEHLNAEWHTSYTSWDALLLSTNTVDASAANADFKPFAEEMIELYYQTCETEMKRITPHKLNLGSRLHGNNPIAIRASARHCDVVSFNKYTTSTDNLHLPEDLDRPIIIGEFHFFDWERSFTADPNRNPLTAKQRADGYWYYVRSALHNPAIVGVHWFQYLDQPLTGRGDGENYPIGFLDVTDTPYPELTAEARRVGQLMYSQRLETLPTSPKVKTRSQSR